MKFIKHVASLGLALSLLSACSFVPTSQNTNSSSDQGTESREATSNNTKMAASDSDAHQIEGQVPASVNPYLSQKPNNIPSSAKTLFAAAVSSLENNKLTAAESQFTRLTEEYPKLSGPWLNLGLIHQRTERPESAQTNFQRAIAANKTNLDAYNQLGILLREQGKFDEAEQQYLRALNIWPDHAASHRNLGILYDLYLGRLEDALKHYERAQTLEAKKPVRGWIADIKRRIATVSE